VRTWRLAWAEALYGTDGFYTTGGGGAGRDFRTPATADPRGLAAALLGITGGVQEIADVGGGDGSLLRAFAELLPGAELLGIDLAPRPAALAARIGWQADLPDRLSGLVVACEWLDVVPCDVVEDGRVVLLDDAGVELPGPEPAPQDVAWLDRWWPRWRDGARVECGRHRDEAWAGLAARLAPGSVAVLIDYGHDRDSRPNGGALAGFSGGRQSVPVTDGSADLTAGVALDSLVAAVPGTVLCGAPMRAWPDHHWLVLERHP